MEEDHPQESHCRNCGEVLRGEFCHRCGQPERHLRAPIRSLLAEWLQEYATLDTRFLRSFISLLFRPGFLTNEYIAGRRARYIPPLRLYLFVSVVFFFVLTTRTTYFSAENVAVGDNELLAPGIVVKMDTAADDTTARKTFEVESQREGILYRLSRYIETKIETSGADVIRQNFTTGFKSNLPRMMFLLLPVFALLLKILYARRKTLYVDHLIFSIHFHCFLFLALLAIAFVQERKGPILFLLLFYLFLSLRGVYRQSLGKTLLKTSLLILGYSLAFGAAMIGTALVSLLMA